MEAQVVFNLKSIEKFCSETVPWDFIYRARNVYDCSNLLPNINVTNVIVWDPQILIKNLSIYCPICKGFVHPIRWKDGTKRYEGPRKLYGLKENVLLISRVYRCEKGHQILAHDPEVLSQSNSILMEPFLLFHKGGITRELYEFIISHIDIGLSPFNIHVLWRQIKYNWQVSLKIQYQKWQFVNQKNSSDIDDITELNEQMNDEFASGLKMITSCLIESYFSKETFYTNRMAQKNARTISADHTFKVSTNIGVLLQGKRLKLYDSLFIVLNEKGKYISNYLKCTKFGVYFIWQITYFFKFGVDLIWRIEILLKLAWIKLSE